MLLLPFDYRFLAFDHLRGEPRNVRFDRFRTVEIEDGSTFHARPAEFAARLMSEYCREPLHAV